MTQEGIYRCRDRQGVVHLAMGRSPFIDSPNVDETLCGEANYMDRTSEKVTCVGCIAEEGALT